MAVAFSSHVLGDRRLRDLEPQFQQFPVDARRAPEGIRNANLPDQMAQLGGDLWTPTCPCR